MTYFVRTMQLKDISQVAQIEREAFPPPWPSTNFRHELTANSLTYYFVAYEKVSERKELSTEGGAKGGSSTHRSMLEALLKGLKRLFGREDIPADPSESVLGFAGLWFMADEAHLANIAVLEAQRRQGIGERLLIEAIELAIERKARFITLEVRATNKVAQALYRKYGLVEVGTRRGYYMDNKEDAVIMTADAITSATYLNSFQKLKQAHAQRWGISSS